MAQWPAETTMLATTWKAIASVRFSAVIGTQDASAHVTGTSSSHVVQTMTLKRMTQPYMPCGWDSKPGASQTWRK